MKRAVQLVRNEGDKSKFNFELKKIHLCVKCLKKRTGANEMAIKKIEVLQNAKHNWH